MSNGEDSKGVFSCPVCNAKFKAEVYSTPKAYRCPNKACKRPVTIFPNGSISDGDHTKGETERIESESLAILDDIEKVITKEKKADASDGECMDPDEERKLMEIARRSQENLKWLRGSGGQILSMA